MEIVPLGAYGEVGRSAFLVKSKEGNLLLDYGVKLQGLEPPQYPKNPFLLVNNIDLALISHGHLDHIGYLPWLFKKHKFPWFSTPPTLDIGEVLWRDSVKLARIKGIEDHYHYKAMEKAKKWWYPALFNTSFRHAGFSFKFHDAGHILGSASISVEVEDKILHYSGDVGYRSFLQGPYQHPGEVDVLMVESTYADTDHPPRDEVLDEFIEEIYEALDNGGHALIPAFAVGRTQELLYALYKKDKNLKVYVDGMGREVSRIYLKYPSYYKNFKGFEEAVENAIFVESPRQRKEALEEPCVILTTAGMLDGGPALYYITSLRQNSKVLLTGYQAEGTNGRLLLDTGKIVVDEYELRVPHEAKKFDFSAHIGKSQIIEYIEKANPSEVWLIHSEEEKAQALKEEIKERGFEVAF